MKQPCTYFDAGKKVEILHEHLENNVSISELSLRFNIPPNQIHQGKKQLLEGALEIFNHKHNCKMNPQEQKMPILENTLYE